MRHPPWAGEIMAGGGASFGGTDRLLTKADLRGVWVVMGHEPTGVRTRPGQFKAASRARARRPTPVPTTAELPQSLGDRATPDSIRREPSAELSGWKTTSLAGDAGRESKPPPPAHARAQPRPPADATMQARIPHTHFRVSADRNEIESSSQHGRLGASGTLDRRRQARRSSLGADAGGPGHQWLRRKMHSPPVPNVVAERHPPLYYIEGATGYDTIQHRPSAGLPGGRIFSMRSHPSVKPRAGLVGQRVRVHAPHAEPWRQEYAEYMRRATTSLSSLGSFGTTAWGEETNDTIRFEDSLDDFGGRVATKAPSESRKFRALTSSNIDGLPERLGATEPGAATRTRPRSTRSARPTSPPRIVTKERPKTSGGHDFFLGRRPANGDQVLHSQTPVRIPTASSQSRATDRPTREDTCTSPADAASNMPPSQPQKAAGEPALCLASNREDISHAHTPWPGTPEPTVAQGSSPAQHGPMTPQRVLAGDNRNRGPDDTHWECVPVREVKPDPSICTLGAGRKTVNSAEPFRDSLRPMTASKMFTREQQQARKGGVFRAVMPRGSLMVRRHFQRRQSADDFCAEEDIYVDDGECLDNDPELWIEKDPSMDMPAVDLHIQARTMSAPARRTEPALGHGCVMLDAEFLPCATDEAPGNSNACSDRSQVRPPLRQHRRPGGEHSRSQSPTSTRPETAPAAEDIREDGMPARSPSPLPSSFRPASPSRLVLGAVGGSPATARHPAQETLEMLRVVGEGSLIHESPSPTGSPPRPASPVVFRASTPHCPPTPQSLRLSLELSAQSPDLPQDDDAAPEVPAS